MAWLGTWTKRTKITVDNTNIDNDLTHFPVPIVLGTSVGQSSQDLSRIFDEVGSESLKIAITKVDGITQIYGDIEQWDDINEKAAIHVAKSDLDITSASVTELYIYYDSSESDNTTYISPPTGVAAGSVYTADTEMNHNMANSSPAGDNIADSTSNNRTGVKGDTANIIQVDALNGLGQDFDDDEIEIADVAALDLAGNFTIEAVVNIDDLSSNRAILSKFWDGSTRAWHFTSETTGIFAFVMRQSGDGSDTKTSSAVGSAVTGSYIYVAIRNNGTDYQMFVAGIASGSSVTKKTMDTNNADVSIGDYSHTSAHNYFDGIISLIRVSSTDRSDAWIKATNYAITDDLLTYGAEEDFITKVATPIITPSSGAYPTSQLISMSCATIGADIYYTLDGSTPDSGDNLYSTPFTLSTAKTIKAIGIDGVLDDSDIVTEIYTISATLVTKLYIDGVLIDSFTSSVGSVEADAGGSFIGQLQSSLGGGFDVNKALDGQISKTRFYRSSVDQAKVTELFNELKVMPTGQEVYYKMDLITGGDTIIDEGGNYDGTVVGGITIESGLIGNCTNLNGTTGYVTLDGFIASLSGSTTMLGLSFFINTSTLPPTNPNAIFSMCDGTATNNLQVGIQTDGKLYIYTPDLGATDIDVGDITDSEWHKILVVFYQDSCYLYVDKQVINISRTAGFGSIMNLITKVSIGQEYDPGLTASDFYAGKLDDFRIFIDTDISSAEEHYLYEIGFPIPGTLEKRLNSFLNLKMRSTRDTYDSFRDFDFNINRSGYGYGYGNFYGG